MTLIRKVHMEDNWYIYVLDCTKGTYVGITSNPSQRLATHMAGKVPSTSSLGVKGLLGRRFIGKYIIASKLERHSHQTGDISFIVDHAKPFPQEALELKDTKFEAQVREFLRND